MMRVASESSLDAQGYILSGWAAENEVQYFFCVMAALQAHICQQHYISNGKQIVNIPIRIRRFKGIYSRIRNEYLI